MNPIRNLLEPAINDRPVQERATLCNERQNEIARAGLADVYCWIITSHSAYVATETESNGVKIDGLLPPNFL